MRIDRRASATTLWLCLSVIGFSMACGTNHRSATSEQTSSATAAAPNGPDQPVDLTGCLQQGSDGTYILTELNKPSRPDSSNPGVVAREKLAAAEDTYVLRGGNDADLRQLVGDRVRVEGTIARTSDLVGTQPQASGQPVGTSGELKALASGSAIKQHDLAALQVTSAPKVAGSCGTHAASAASHSK